jgi:hypothetical protein
MECFIDGARTPSQSRLAALLNAWRTRGDRRAHFCAGYVMATDTVLLTARAGRFLDSAWVLRLLDQWAEYYLITVEPEGDDLSLVTPPAWADAHGAAALHSTTAAEALILGVNAHVNNDLPQALCAVLGDEWPLSAQRLERRRTDFDKLVGVVADTMDSVQILVTRFDAKLLGSQPANDVASLITWDVNRLCASWHGGVWEDALSLLTAVDLVWATAIREGIECTATRRAHLLMCTLEERERLMLLPGGALDQAFPHRHDTVQCRLPRTPPVWGDPVATSHL